MKFRVVVQPRDQFEAWVAAQKTAPATPDPSSLEGKGLAAFRNPANQCIACHTVDGKNGVGPTWKGIAGHDVDLADGSKVKGDDAYLKESITNPNVKIVKGFAANIMPATFGQQLKPEEIDGIVEYIKTLQ